MLKKIQFNNFTTFFNSTEIDFEATNYKFLAEENVGKNKILKGCLFVGENASGKTMILKGIKLLLDLLFEDNNEMTFFQYKSFYTKNRVCSIKYTFLIEDKEIVYSFEFDERAIVTENLIYDGKKIMDRIGSSAVIEFDGNKKIEDISAKMLFLRRLYFDTNFYGDKTLIKWLEFLKNSVYVNCYEHEVCFYSKNLSIHSIENEGFKEKINDFFKRINYNQEIELMKSINSNSNVVLFKKSGTEVRIVEPFESTGNKTLIEVLPIFINLIENPGMLIYDEFSSGLHNELEECIIKYFFHFAQNSQLFFTSHSTNILNNTVLRPDQVYAVGFDSKKGAYVRRFSDESPRESQNLEKMYLNGVFDGLPRYNKFF